MDPNWHPLPGQTYKDDAPNALCVITKVTSTSVYWQYADKDGKPTGGKTVVNRADWEYT
jgi:hypothetical protein